MKAIVKALNKNYLVEFKNDADFLGFVTNFNDKIEDVEVITEDKLPELEKPVDVAKPTLSNGWDTLNKSAFVDKEKGVEKKGMTLGGKYAEFKYEPDKNLENATDDKVSDPKIDSPALKGDEPKVSDVEATAKENEVDAPKADAPKAESSEEKSEEPKAEPAKEEAPKSEEPKAEEKKEEPAEEPKKEESDDKEDKEEKKKVEESVEGEFDKAYEEAYEVWNNAGSNEEDLYSICSDVADKYGVDADKLFKKIEDAEEEAPLFESYEAELNEVMEAAGIETNNINELKKQLEYAVRILRLYQDIEVNGQDYASKFLVKYGYARKMPDTNGEEDYYGTDSVRDVPRQLDAKY